MTTPRVDQLLPAAHAGDATGDATLHLTRALREAGYRADVYALSVDDDLRDRVLPFDRFPAPGPDDTTLLHFALPSRLTRALQEVHGRRAIVYHNLTPPELLLPHCPDIARLTAIGRRELGELAASRRVDLAIGVSEFNTRDLQTTGFDSTATLPLPMDMDRYDGEPDALLQRDLEEESRLILTVGRIAPNKRLELFLRVAAYYLRYCEPDARFVIVGGGAGLEAYQSALVDLHARLGLDERVRFAGRVSHAELIATYRAAAAYLCTSEHEGFCAPLLEAMHFEVPIVARAAAAIPETLGGAGVLANSTDPAELAEMLHLVLTDTALAEKLRRRAGERVAQFRPAAVTGRWLETIERLRAS